MWKLYQMAMASGLVAAAPYLIARRGKHYFSTFPGRLGRYEEPAEDPVQRGSLWLHAVSVGEVGVAQTLARALPPDLPLLITTVTPTGQAQAQRIFNGKDFADRRTAVAYLPFDLGFAVERFFERFDPSALILIEGDYWPLVLRAAQKRNLPVAVANGRISQRSFPRLQRLYQMNPNFCRAFFDPVSRFGVQTDEDRQRLIQLGVSEDRILATGNLKYDTAAPDLSQDLEALVKKLADSRPILVAGSTMAGEDELVLEAFACAGGGERALLTLAPRHPERFDAVASRIERAGLTYVRRSQENPKGRPAVLLLDTLGELAALYRLANIAFIGGTLVATGGHNPLESARFGVPTVVGPSMHNFKQIAEDFERGRAWETVGDRKSLAQVFKDWLAEPENAREVGRRAADLVASGQGAVDRTLQFLDPLLRHAEERFSARAASA